MEILQVRNSEGRIKTNNFDNIRASIWWKYLDHNTVLPPPFTPIFLLYSASRTFCWKKVDHILTEEESLYDRRDFNKKYKKLLLTLIKNEDNSWGVNLKKKASGKSSKSMMDCGGD